MKDNVEHLCSTHSNPFDCPDNLIYYAELSRQFGIIIHDGSGSMIKIKYCPFCGEKL
jgi:hypothetical protein